MPLFGYVANKARTYLAFEFERTWWMLFQKRTVRSQFNIYVFINVKAKYKSYIAW